MKIKQLGICFIFSVLSCAAFSGYVQDANVIIDNDEKLAHGNMKTARYSTNEFELIGCGVRARKLSETEMNIWGFCQARISETESVMCFTLDPQMVEQMDAIASYSYIIFQWNDDGECTYVGTSTQSFYLPINKKESKAAGS